MNADDVPHPLCRSAQISTTAEHCRGGLKITECLQAGPFWPAAEYPQIILWEYLLVKTGLLCSEAIVGGTAHLAQWKSHDLVLRYRSRSRSRHLKMGIDYTNIFFSFQTKDYPFLQLDLDLDTPNCLRAHAKTKVDLYRSRSRSRSNLDFEVFDTRRVD